jgi:hypothetical protein
LPGISHNEQIAEALVKDNFGGQATVTAPEKSGPRVLRNDEVLSSIDILPRMRWRAVNEPLVAREHVGPGLRRG